MRFRWLFVSLLALAAIACGGTVSDDSGGDTPANQSSVPDSSGLNADGSIGGLITYPEPSRDHDPDLQYDYEALPQHGGEHNPIWMNCGIYAEPVPPELVVHSLEHGAIWITYQENSSAATISALRDVVGDNSHLLLSPYPSQRSPIVLTSWAYQLELESPSDPRLAAFIGQFLNDPATAPEPGATCAGGFGDPLN